MSNSVQKIFVAIILIAVFLIACNDSDNNNATGLVDDTTANSDTLTNNENLIDIGVLLPDSINALLDSILPGDSGLFLGDSGLVLDLVDTLIEIPLDPALFIAFATDPSSVSEEDLSSLFEGFVPNVTCTEEPCDSVPDFAFPDSTESDPSVEVPDSTDSDPVVDNPDSTDSNSNGFCGNCTGTCYDCFGSPICIVSDQNDTVAGFESCTIINQ